MDRITRPKERRSRDRRFRSKIDMSLVAHDEVKQSGNILSGPVESRDFPDWFREQQREAWKQFQSLPSPTRKDQLWRFANVDLLDLTPFKFGGVDNPFYRKPEAVAPVEECSDFVRTNSLFAEPSTDGRLEKFFSPSLCESDSVTARENGQMERARHGTEGLFRS